jgi:hypothetical protein
MSIKGSHVKTAKVACAACGMEFTRSGLVGHKRFIHGQSALNARLSDIIPDDLPGDKAALEAQLSDVQNALGVNKDFLKTPLRNTCFSCILVWAQP